MPEEPAKVKAPIIIRLADIIKWTIAPSKDGSDSTLRLEIAIKNFEDVQVIRDLAKGGIVTLRLLPLQAKLPEDLAGCAHPSALSMSLSPTQRVCLECGLILDIPPEDQKPEEPPAQ